MNILLLGLPLFVQELRLLGHTVTTAGTTDDRDLVLEPAEFSMPNLLGMLGPKRQPDICLVIEEMRDRRFPLRIEECPSPLVFYSIDTHLNNFWLEEFAPVCDLVLTTQKDYVETLKRRGGEVAWLPWSVHPDEFMDLGVERDLDMAFIGTIDDHRQRRKSLLAQLSGRFQVTLGTPGRFYSPQESSTIFSRARIVINEAISSELNFRVFETMATGAMLLTEQVGNGLTDLFIDGKEIVTFTPYDVISKADHYLRNETERSEIAAAGQRAVRERHSRQVRAAELAELLQQALHRGKVARGNPGGCYLLMLRRGLIDRGQYLAETERLLTTSCRNTPDDGERIALLAEFYAADNRSADAVQLFQSALNCGFHNFRMLAQWGLLTLEAGDEEAARGILSLIAEEKLPHELREGLKNALSGRLPSMDLYRWLGRIAETTGDRFQPGFFPLQSTALPFSGLDYLNRSLAGGEEQPESYALIGDIFWKNRVYLDAADNYLKALITGGYRNAELAFQAAQALAWSFRLEDALQLARLAWDLRPHPRHLELMQQLDEALAASVERITTPAPPP